MITQGQRVGEYVLEREIGKGRFGHVWLAQHHMRHNMRAAAKIPTDAGCLRALQHEGEVLQGLDHPNIIHCLTLDPFADTPYLIMEYVEGSSLRPLIRGRLLDIGPTLAVLEQVLTGLSYAHDRGVIHRDLKPENVLIDQRVGSLGFNAPGMVKVADFGLARSPAAAVVGESSIVLSGSLGGSSGMFRGTPGYAAPEVLDGVEADALSDVYACGVLLFEMVTGYRPAGAESLEGMQTPIAVGLNKLLGCAYARREKRFSSAAAFLEAVRDLRKQLANACEGCSSSAHGDSSVEEAPRRAAAQASAEAERRRREAARVQQCQAEVEACQAEAERAEATARRAAADAAAEREKAERQKARNERLRVDAESERLKSAARAERHRQKGAAEQAHAEAAARSYERRQRETQQAVEAERLEAALRRLHEPRRRAAAARFRRGRTWTFRLLMVVAGIWILDRYGTLISIIVSFVAMATFGFVMTRNSSKTTL